MPDQHATSLLSRTIFMPALLLTALLASPTSLAQQPTPTADQTASVLSLDLDRYVYERASLRVNDKVWRLQAQSGRKIVVLPLRVSPVSEPTKISRSPIKVRKGRFIGFMVPPADTRRSNRANTADLSELAIADAQAFGQLLLGETSESEQNAPAEDASDPNEASEEEPASKEDADTQIEPVPENAPRLARSLAFMPDGTVQWGMDRSFSGAEINNPGGSNLYGYKLSPDKLIAEQPEKPKRIERRNNESSSDFARRRSEQQKKDREKQTEFRKLRDSVRKLPTDFREATPAVVYAIFDAADEDKIEIEGPEPLPWTLRPEDEAQYQQLLSATAGMIESNELLIALTNRAKEDVVSARVIAYGAARGGLPGRVKQDDAGHLLLEQLASSKDKTTRRVALYAAAQASPANSATADLLKSAGQRAEGVERQAIQVAALGKLLEVFNAKPQDPEMLIAGVNQMLADPKGPGAARVIHRLISVTTDTRGRRTTTPSDALIGFVRFDTIPADQTDKVINEVVGQAHRNTLAAGWLSENLLASDSKLLDKTLATLDKTRSEQPEASENDRSKLQPLTIPIDSSKHGLVVALNSDNAKRRTSAWAVLDRFHIEPRQVSIEEQGAEKPMTAAQLMDLILSSAGAQTKTPDTLIPFIEGQVESNLTREAPTRLVLLLANPSISDDIKKTIAKRVMATEGQYSDVLRRLEGSQRPDVVAGLYQAEAGKTPLVVGLLAQQQGRLLDWLSDHIEQGKLPDDAAWVDQLFNGRTGIDQLINHAAGVEPKLAQGAAAALVLSVGGNLNEQVQFAQQIEAMDKRDAESVKQGWTTFRVEVLTRVLAEAQGTYRLVVTLKKPAEPGDEDAQEESKDKAERIEVGLVKLASAGAAVSLSVEGLELSIAPERLAIRIDAPASLKSLESAALEDLPWDSLKGPLDLLPTKSGIWSGQIGLSDGRDMAVALEPVE